MRRAILTLFIALAQGAPAQQPGTLDNSFATDGILYLDPGLNLFPGGWQIHELGDGRYFLLQPPMVTTPGIAAVLVEGQASDTLLYESAPWSIPAQPNSTTTYENGKLNLVSTTNLSWTIARHELSGEVDASFGVDGTLLIPIQSFDVGDVVDARNCWQSPTGSWYCSVQLSNAQYSSSTYLIKTDAAGLLDESFGTLGKKFLGSSATVKSIRWLTNGDFCVWTGQSAASPFSPGHDRFVFMSASGTTLQESSTGWPQTWFYSSMATSLIADENNVAIFTEGGVASPTRLCRTAMGEPMLCFEDVYEASEFPYNEYPAARFFAADGFGRAYYAVNPIEFNQPCRWFIARRNNDGTRDLQFGNIQTPFSAEYSLSGGFVQADGKLVAYGSGGGNHVVVRYHNISDPRTRLRARLFLGGAYEPGTGLMRDDIRQEGLVPLLQPYTGQGFTPANGLGGWSVPQSVLAWEGDSAMVDWVWLELLSTADSSTVVATRVGLLHRNGWVTANDGRSPIDFGSGSGAYFLRARHRNHLSVTSAQPLYLNTGMVTLDLTNPATPTFGTEAQMEVGGVQMLWPCDVSGDGRVKYVGTGNDRDPILLRVGASTPTAIATGYWPEDANLDGIVKYVGQGNDRDLILQVIDPAEPTSVRIVQQP